MERIVLHSCVVCHYYVPYKNMEMHKGECHRYPPNPEGEFPVVKDLDWCGELISDQ